MTTANTKILERIQALLAMGGDVSSPKEAAIALRRARKLMDEHQVTMSDIENAKQEDAELGEEGFDSSSKRQRLWVSTLALAIGKMNDCVVGLSRDRASGYIHYIFKGFKEDAQVCEFMLAYIVETAKRSYKLKKDELGLSGLGDKNDFLTGFSQEVSSRIHTMIEEREKELASGSKSYALIVSKKALVESTYGEQETKKAHSKKRVNYNAYHGGIKEGRKVHLGASVTNNATSSAMLQ